MGFKLGIFIIGTILVAADASNWGYVHEKGPNHWADLFPDACSGQHQSPIDIKSKQTVYDPTLKDIVVFYDPPLPGSKFYVHNNGHSIQVNTEGKFYVSNGGLPNIYSTAQFHFHWGHKNHHGSEHTIDGEASPIEMHIVNWNSDKYSSIAEAAVEPAGLAVLGILFEVTNVDNPAFTPLVNVLKHVRDPDKKIKTEIPAVSMRTFLPKATNMYYRYNGSLTTPGCFESVIWTVYYMKQTISRRQLHVFRQVLKPTHHRKKRSAHHHETKGERHFFQELGIENNNFAKARLRRQLEEKVEASVHDSQNSGVAVEEPAPDMPAENTTHEHTDNHKHHHDHNQNGGSGHTSKPEPVNTGGKTNNHEATMSNMEKVRKMLVNNYRPVQPLNGRIVYRSFPFFGEKIPSDIEVVYLDTDGSQNQKGYRDNENSAPAIRVISLVTMVCSIIISKLL
ncbi:carbonic anhydrase 14-like [Ruditapes philippinarum]|uniref:carbonic anhydrase 14-like n=1 Tax=Ruditapes philippinarum TaxID=129788 RepID=UPI00295A77F2|nr:carbonic anhydrase 14-like [Ruditapes philippinarum]